ncbi:MAG TPA: type II toxin-antitoxin system ParD family antitoxin [Nostocaceae cyanobacterium]|nr:type II toxin-antitoxin system ParD family antitoxin [Nostocaceae cyanobacterium]
MDNILADFPQSLTDFINEQVAKGGYNSISEYLKFLVFQEQKRQLKKHIEELIVEALDSGERIKVTDEWWEQERQNLIEEFIKKES